MYIIANGSWQENNAKLANKYAIFAQLQKKYYLYTRKTGGNPPKNRIAYERQQRHISTKTH